jgi:hypothetical protein
LPLILGDPRIIPKDSLVCPFCKTLRGHKRAALSQSAVAHIAATGLNLGNDCSFNLAGYKRMDCVRTGYKKLGGGIVRWHLVGSKGSSLSRPQPSTIMPLNLQGLEPTGDINLMADKPT